jgi:hypothetical protein
VDDLSVKFSPAGDFPGLADAPLAVLDTLGFSDSRDISFCGFLVMASCAKNFAVLQRWFAAKSVRNVVVIVKLAD